MMVLDNGSSFIKYCLPSKVSFCKDVSSVYQSMYFQTSAESTSLHFCSSHPRFHSCHKLNMVLIKGIGPLKIKSWGCLLIFMSFKPKTLFCGTQKEKFSRMFMLLFSIQWWWVSTLKKHHKTARCLVHYNRSLLDWKFCHDLLNLKTVPNLHGFLSSAEHKRRYSEECWWPNSCWFPRASTVWRKNMMEVSEDQKIFFCVTFTLHLVI